MRRLILSACALSVLLAVRPAQAQDLGPSPAERVAVTGAAALGGVAAVAGTYALARSADDTPVRTAVVVAAYPAGLTLGTLAAAHVLGLEADPAATARDAAVGTAAAAFVGMAVGLGVAWSAYTAAGNGDGDIAAPILGIGAGSAVALVLSATMATQGVEAGPAAFRAPTGETGAGLTLRVGL